MLISAAPVLFGESTGQGPRRENQQHHAYRIPGQKTTKASKAGRPVLVGSTAVTAINPPTVR